MPQSSAVRKTAKAAKREIRNVYTNPVRNFLVPLSLGGLSYWRYLDTNPNVAYVSSNFSCCVIDVSPGQSHQRQRGRCMHHVLSHMSANGGESNTRAAYLRLPVCSKAPHTTDSITSCDSKLSCSKPVPLGPHSLQYLFLEISLLQPLSLQQCINSGELEDCNWNCNCDVITSSRNCNCGAIRKQRARQYITRMGQLRSAN